ncbi:MAG: MBOAT family O-acyltransferase, partial [Steroidobacteraceae bacterium]
YIAALGVARRTVTHRDRLKSAAFTLVVTAACGLFVLPDALWLMQVMSIFVVILLTLSYFIDCAPQPLRPRLWLQLSIFANLGVLAYFKYCNFFIDSVQASLTALGWQVDEFTLKIILPVGLSFHVFQGISRTFDCYRGVVKPEGSLTTVATYLAFFPQLVAGPIERAKHLIPQFESTQTLNWNLFSSGALLFTWGLFLKLVIADNVAPIANLAFANSASLSGGEAVVGILAFTVQIYCDFCGYSNMARGLARCLGFDLMANFNLPYFARTPSEFWRRWHISLSTWLRDYLYVSLGGNRKGEGRMYANLMITMLLGGLWHGAAWTFVVWGAFHGAIQVAYRLLHVDELLERVRMNSLPGILLHIACWALTMTLVIIGWVYFRAESFGQASNMLAAALRTDGYTMANFGTLLTYVVPLALVESYQRLANRLEVLNFRPFLLRYTATLIVVMAILLASAPPGQSFIYFDF